MFSIIIPVGPGRNAQVALTSLLKAGLSKDDEVIVVGDGHEVLIPSEFESLPIVSTKTPTPSGANAARNLGAEWAKGSILCFLDDDDQYAVNALSEISGFTQDSSVGAWSLGWKFLSGRRPRIQKHPSVISEKSIGKRNTAGGCSSMLVRKEVFQQAGGFDQEMPSMQDWDLWLRLCRTTTIRRIPKALIVYDDVHDQRISTNHSARAKGLQKLLQKHRQNWPSRVIKFHEVRLAALRCEIEGGALFDILTLKAPWLSSYYFFKAVFRRT